MKRPAAGVTEFQALLDWRNTPSELGWILAWHNVFWAAAVRLHCQLQELFSRLNLASSMTLLNYVLGKKVSAGTLIVVSVSFPL